MNNLNEIKQSINIIEALEIIETPYKELIIKMYETEHDIYTVNIINSSGEVIHAMTDILHWEEADMWAMGFIDGYLLRNAVN